MQEILLLIVIALAIFYIPRLRSKKSSPAPQPAARRRALPGWMRLAIMLSLLWIAAVSVLLEPWQGEILPFLYIGPGPVIAFWGALWVWFGYRRT